VGPFTKEHPAAQHATDGQQFRQKNQVESLYLFWHEIIRSMVQSQSINIASRAYVLATLQFKITGKDP
jgi:hypothetical protein